MLIGVVIKGLGCFAEQFLISKQTVAFMGCIFDQTLITHMVAYDKLSESQE